MVSKLTLVRSKTDNVLIIKNKQAARQQPAKRRAGRALKPKRPRLDADEDQDKARRSSDKQPDHDTQSKIVKVILENCKSSTTDRLDVSETVGGSSPPRDAVDVPATSEVLSTTISSSCEASTSVHDELTVCSAAVDRVVLPVTSSTCVHKTELTCASSSTSMMTTTPVLAPSAASLRLNTPLNGVISQLPLAVGHRLQLIGHPTARNLQPVAAAQRWSVPLVNGSATWLTLQPVASTSSASIMAPSAGSLGLIAAPGAAQTAAPRRPVVFEQPRQVRPYLPLAHSSVINSPIKQFLDHTRCVPLPHATDDAPTDLSMKTLRRLEQNSAPVDAVPTQDDDLPLDLCTKRPSPAADCNSAQRCQEMDKTPPVLPILTVPLCFPTSTDDRPRLSVAGQLSTSCTPGCAAIKLVQPATPLLQLDSATVRSASVAAGAGSIPLSPITILHPAFRQLSPFLCSPLLMTPFTATSGSVQRHPTDSCVTSSSA